MVLYLVDMVVGNGRPKTLQRCLTLNFRLKKGWRWLGITVIALLGEILVLFVYATMLIIFAPYLGGTFIYFITLTTRTVCICFPFTSFLPPPLYYTFVYSQTKYNEQGNIYKSGIPTTVSGRW